MRLIAVFGVLLTAASCHGEPRWHKKQAEWARIADTAAQRRAWAERARFWTFTSATLRAGLATDSVRVALLREVARLTVHDLGGRHRSRVFCVSLGPPGSLRAPSESLVSGLELPGARFLDVRRCYLAPTLNVVDTLTDHAALLIWTDSIPGLVADTLTASGGYHAEPLMAAEWTCVLRRTPRGWEASDCSLDWIS